MLLLINKQFESFFSRIQSDAEKLTFYSVSNDYSNDNTTLDYYVLQNVLSQYAYNGYIAPVNIYYILCVI